MWRIVLGLQGGFPRYACVADKGIAIEVQEPSSRSSSWICAVMCRTSVAAWR